MQSNFRFEKFGTSGVIFILLMIFMFLLPFTQVLSKGGLTDENIKFQLIIYMLLGLIGFISVFVLVYFNAMWRKNDTYGDSFGFGSLGEKPSFETFKNRFTGVQLTWLSYLSFGTLFLLANTLRYFNVLRISSFTGVKVLPQQFSPTDSLIFSTLLIPSAENLFFTMLLGCIVFGLQFLAIKYNWSYKQFRAILIFAVLVFGALFGYLWHSTVYSTDEEARNVVFYFWMIGGFISVATGLFTPFLAMHMTNNFFIDLANNFSTESVLFGAFAVLLVGWALYGLYYRRDFFGRKKIVA